MPETGLRFPDAFRVNGGAGYRGFGRWHISGSYWNVRIWRHIAQRFAGRPPWLFPAYRGGATVFLCAGHWLFGQFPVITSYSIHYTKLYEGTGRQWPVSKIRACIGLYGIPLPAEARCRGEF